MSIVFITVPGDEKRMFANALHKKTGGKVELVIIQKPKKLSLPKRIKRLYNRTGWRYLSKELWYAFLLRLDGAKRVLEYFRKYTISGPAKYVPKYIEVDSVNSDEVYELIQEISPKLLVIWGNTILDSRLLKTAGSSINLHMGYCPLYRGALANQNAVLQEDFEHIGATIHYAKEKVDSGDILARLTADLTKPPKEMFRDLNDRVLSLYIETAKKIYTGEKMSANPQDISGSKNLLLKHWVPSVRYTVGSKILRL
jgi:folate-dependent phosphoribosylglycinamide formyltransferase PurN